MPYYFSGANSRAYGNLYPYPVPEGWSGPAPVFEDAQLYIGGELVRTWTRNPNDVPAWPLTLGVMFDSSHFMYDTSVHVRITGHDNIVLPGQTQGRFYDSDVDDPGNDAPVKNLGTVYGRYDQEAYWDLDRLTWDSPSGSWQFLPPSSMAVDIVAIALEGMKYKEDAHTNMGWTAGEVFNNLQISNVF